MADSPSHVSPLEFDDFRLFLESIYKIRKVGLKYSYRQYAEDLGFTASNYIHLVIKGQRNLSSEAIQKISKSLHLKAQERAYFEALVFFQQSESLAEKEVWKKKLEKYKQSTRHLLSEEQFHYFSYWYLPIIREMISLASFVPNLNWIARKLKAKIGEDLIFKALSILESLKLVTRHKSGWKLTKDHIVTTNEVSSDVIMEYHQQMLEFSRIALNFPQKDRDFSAMTMSLSKSQMEWVKKRVVAFRDELQQELESMNEPSSLVAQLNIQLFQVTND